MSHQLFYVLINESLSHIYMNESRTLSSRIHQAPTVSCTYKWVTLSYTYKRVTNSLMYIWTSHELSQVHIIEPPTVSCTYELVTLSYTNEWVTLSFTNEGVTLSISMNESLSHTPMNESLSNIQTNEPLSHIQINESLLHIQMNESLSNIQMNKPLSHTDINESLTHACNTTRLPERVTHVSLTSESLLYTYEWVTNSLMYIDVRRESLMTQHEFMTHVSLTSDSDMIHSLISDSDVRYESRSHSVMWDMSHELTHQWFCDTTWVTHVWTHVRTHSLVIQMWDMSHELTHQWFYDTTWVMNSSCVISDSRLTSMYMREFVTHSYVYKRDSLVSETWVTHSGRRTHSWAILTSMYMREFVTPVTSMYMREFVTHSYVYERDSWVILRHNMSHSLNSDSSLTSMYMREFVTNSYVRERVRDSFICMWERLVSDTATQHESLTHQWFRYETWVTHSRAQHGSSANVA